jgi:hypothetical protein
MIENARGMKRLLCAGAASTGVFLAFAAGVVAGGCSGGHCGDAGCESDVSVWLVNKVDPAPGVERVQFCAEGQCERVSLRRRVGGATLPIQDPGERDVEIELTVVGHGGETLARETQTLTLEEFRPNGSGCEPTCYGASAGSYDIRNLEWDES